MARSASGATLCSFGTREMLSFVHENTFRYTALRQSAYWKLFRNDEARD
jgi:hypothetical protein